MIARRSLCPEKLGSNPGQGSKGINLSGWHGIDMSFTVTKKTLNSNKPNHEFDIHDGGGGGNMLIWQANLTRRPVSIHNECPTHIMCNQNVKYSIIVLSDNDNTRTQVIQCARFRTIILHNT